MNEQLVAHIDAADARREEALVEHLALTEEIGSSFGAVFHAEYLVRVLCRVHDLGKASESFQTYIRNSAGDSEEGEGRICGDKRIRRGPDHSTAGAQFLAEGVPGIGLLLAYATAGHHGGLPDGLGTSEGSLAARLKKQVHDWMSAAKNALGKDFLAFDGGRTAKEIAPFLVDGYSCSFLIRMLYSCLVDADFLATELFMNQEQGRERKAVQATPTELHEQLTGYYARLTQRVRQSGSQDLEVNLIRNEVRQDCHDQADSPPGLFTLTVPTGGGKTLASMAFALRHAMIHGLRQVIYVIPYTSIIEQTAGVFSDVFGSDAVLEHHCNVEWEAGGTRMKLLAENWDATIVVTTGVQFFESLHANQSSRCRKLHNLAQAVIVLDEAQTIPVDLLRPCLRALDELVARYGSTVVLCTATQPAVSHERLRDWGLRGNRHGIREIVSHERNLHQRLKRVDLERIQGKIADEDLVRRMEAFPSVLTIVSTRRHARELYSRLVVCCPKETVFHLSAQMCPEHRKQQLGLVRDRLQTGQPCRVISTQLIEAGVDIDFPCVFREQAGLDTIAQAAGRCNREGRMQNKGRVFVFESADYDAPRGFLRTAAQKGAEIMGLPDYAEDLLAPEAVTHYFQALYHNQEEAMDKFEVLSRLLPVDTPRSEEQFFLFCFKSLGRAFKMIDDQSVSLFVPYGDEGQQLCEQLHHAYLPSEQRALARKLQRYAVNLHGSEPLDNKGNRIAEHVHDTYWVLSSPKQHYSDAVGVTFEGMDVFLDV